MSIQDGGARSSNGGPPQWFRDFESRQEQRFDKIAQDFREVCDGFSMEIEGLKEEIKSLKEQLGHTNNKLDDLENRNRRCNLVIFNIPEGAEGSSCFQYVADLIKKSGARVDPLHIQRMHRTGKIQSNASQPQKPRPVHIGFAFYQDKELCRKSLSQYFKQEKIDNAKLFVANDFSARVQQLRREKLPELRKLKAEGKNAFLVYPAVIKVKDSHGNVKIW